MLVPIHGFKKRFAYGGPGIFDTIANFLTRIFTSSAAKQIASSALDVGESVDKEGAKKALDVGKSTAVDVGKKLVTKALMPKSKKIFIKINQLWYKDTTTAAEAANTGWNVRKMYIINISNPKGSFSFKVPLKHIFGFCEDYDKVVYRLKHALNLTINNDTDAVFKNGAADAHGKRRCY